MAGLRVRSALRNASLRPIAQSLAFVLHYSSQLLMLCPERHSMGTTIPLRVITIRDPDTDNSAPVDTFGSDPEGLQSAIDDFRTKRTIAEVVARHTIPRSTAGGA